MSNTDKRAHDAERARRNLNPHAEARLAMTIWSHEYAFEQKGGCMDFWDSLDASRKRMCVDVVDGILKAIETTGRAPRSQSQQETGG